MTEKWQGPFTNNRACVMVFLLDDGSIRVEGMDEAAAWMKQHGKTLVVGLADERPLCLPTIEELARKYDIPDLPMLFTQPTAADAIAADMLRECGPEKYVEFADEPAMVPSKEPS